MAHLRHHAVDASFCRIKWHSSVVKGADTDVAGRMVEYLLVVDTVGRKFSGDRPEPLDQPAEGIFGGKASEVDVPQHLEWIDDPTGVVGDRLRHDRQTTSPIGVVILQDPVASPHVRSGS